MSDETTLSHHLRAKMPQSAKHLASAIVNFMLPPTCGMCRAVIHEQGALCSSCWQKLSFIASPYCACCGLPFSVPVENGQLCPNCLTEPPPYSMARAALVYDDTSRLLITRFKYHDQTNLLPTLTPWLERAAKDMRNGLDLIVPVPMHRWRLWRRTYNQAAIFAHALSQSLAVPMAWRSLKRTRHTPPQVGMNADQRAKNVRKAFSASPNDVKNKCILLVDDVFTTGATLEACTKELLKKGAKEVRVLTLARVVYNE